MNKKWLFSLILILSISVLAACNDTDNATEENDQDANTQEQAPAENSDEGNSENEQDTEQPQMPEPDLEGIPDVIAEVNGTEIAKEDFEMLYQSQFQQLAMQAQMTGEEIDQDQLKTQVADAIIGQELVIQEANNRNVDVSDEEIDEQLNSLASQNGMESADDFLAALEEQQDMGEEEVRTQLATQIRVDQLIASEAGDTTPTEEELQAFYDEAVALEEQRMEESGEEAEIPSFEDVKPSLETQLKNQKEAEAYLELVERLRDDADVTSHL